MAVRIGWFVGQKGEAEVAKGPPERRGRSLWGSLGHLRKGLLWPEDALVGPEQEVWGGCQDPNSSSGSEGVTGTEPGIECGCLAG